MNIQEECIMKGYQLFKVRAILFALILLSTNVFIFRNTSAQSRDFEGSTGSDDGLPGIPAELTTDDWDQIMRAINPTFDQQAYLKASTVDADDYFGYAVAISGDTVVVGAYGEDGNGSNEDDNSADGAGAAYVFVRIGTTWAQQAYLKASNAEQLDLFGFSVAIFGDTVVVGAPGEAGDGSGEGNNSASNAGAAYVFVRSGTTWAQQAYLKASNVDTWDYFGWSVAISSDTVLVGAPDEDGDGSNPGDDSATSAGAAYVFVRSGTAWSQQAYLKASNADALDFFGDGVAISRDTLVVGAYGEDGDGSNPGDDSELSAGAAYVFVRSGTAWSQQAYLKASNVEAGDRFGRSVAISADTIVVGAYGEDGNGSGEEDNSESYAGAAYVFVWEVKTWVQQDYLKASNAEEHDWFGQAVAIYGDMLVVGAKDEDGNGSSAGDNSALGAGAAYVFVRSGTDWSQQAYLKASNVGEGDYFGGSVAIYGDTVVIGAYGEDGNGSGEGDNNASSAGAAYVFNKQLLNFLPLFMR
jgi:hypothetical protein